MADRSAVSHPSEVYRAVVARRDGEIAELDGRIGRVETARMITFLVGAVIGLLRNDLGVTPAVPGAVALIAWVLFVGLVVHHRRLKRRWTRAQTARALATMGRARLERNWSALHAAFDEVGYHDVLLDPLDEEGETHPYLADLDVFGPASIRALLGPTPTPTGVDTLRRWLSAPADPDEVRRRQVAVADLSTDFDSRERLAVEALLVDRVDRVGWTTFVDWVGRPRLFDARPDVVSDGAGAVTLPGWSLLVARTLPPITLVLFTLWAVGVLAASWPWFVLLVIQIALAWHFGRALTPYFAGVSGRSSGLRRHHALFAAWEEHQTECAPLVALQSRLADVDGGRASDAIRDLERWLDAADSRASMLHSIVAIGLLWDVHVAAGLERWRARAGPHVEEWFTVLGELEALSALSTLAHDEPEWVFPDLRDSPPGLDAERLGHPLLSDAVRRTSDVTLDPPGRFLLVTGSNMSGKSTLLRSIGLSAVLAQAGSVVCARRAVLSPLRTFTSMRIHDSLTGGVSHFMAELLRLKALVDAADAADGSATLLYLVDEVLQGTNSDERRIAAQRIVTHLLGANAIGAVTTHDLTLHTDSPLDPASTKVHFREHVDDTSDRVLTFDYVLRPGLATSRNALKLLRIVGLDDGRADVDVPTQGG